MIDQFLAPSRLWLFAGVAALAALYVAAVRWRRRATVRFTQVAMIDTLVPKRPGWRRHVVAAVNLAGLSAGVVAVARPVHTEVERETSQGRIVVLFDVSSSMAATDVDPDRLSAAKAAAELFVDQVDPEVEVGLISFSGTVTVVTPPTLNRPLLNASIAGLTLSPSTAIGDALARGTELLTDLAAAGATADDDGTGEETGGETDDGAAPGALVLLSDGETTVGTPTDEGAAVAAAAGVPVFTIAFGTSEGTITDPTTGQIQSVPVQPGPLRDVATVTGGAAYEAATPEELADAYAQIRDVLQETLGHEVERTTETTWMWAALAVGLLAGGWALSLWWLRGLV